MYLADNIRSAGSSLTDYATFLLWPIGTITFRKSYTPLPSLEHVNAPVKLHQPIFLR